MLTNCLAAGRKQLGEHNTEGLNDHIDGAMRRARLPSSFAIMLLLRFYIAWCKVNMGRRNRWKPFSPRRFKSEKLNTKWMDAHETGKLQQLVSKMEELETLLRCLTR